MGWLIKGIVIVFALSVFFKIIKLYTKSEGNIFNLAGKIPLLITGFIANVADTLGLGSFAIIIALNNRWKMIDDKRLPGTLNAHSVLPAMLQSILFLNFIELDIFLLVVFVAAACVGGLLSGFFVARLDKQSIRLLMSISFAAIALLILANQLHLLPVGGDEISLSNTKILIGIPAMMLAGMLPAIGAGFYVPIQVILFFLGLSPLIAFPIMTTAGAIVQSATAYAFAAKKEIAEEESLLMAFSGVIGVAIAVPLIAYVNLSLLRWLLLFIIIYNASTLWKAYREENRRLIEA